MIFIPIIVAMQETTKGLMKGKSVIPPEMTLPIVFVIPTMEIRKEALSAETPQCIAILKIILRYFVSFHIACLYRWKVGICGVHRHQSRDVCN